MALEFTLAKMAAPIFRTVVDHWPKVLMLLILSAVKSYESDLTKDSQGGCDHVKMAYQAKGFNSKDVPFNVVSGKNLDFLITTF